MPKAHSAQLCAFWVILTFIGQFLTKSGGFLSDLIDSSDVRSFDRNFVKTTTDKVTKVKRLPRRQKHRRSKIVDEFFRPCQANSILLKPLKVVRKDFWRHLIVLWSFHGKMETLLVLRTQRKLRYKKKCQIRILALNLLVICGGEANLSKARKPKRYESVVIN